MKYVDTIIGLSEVPSEISLCINISNCPNHCKGCHSSYLWEDIGTEFTIGELYRLISENKGITCVCLMGGDAEPEIIDKLGEAIHKIGLKSCWYSGKENLPKEIHLYNFDYYKLGPYDEKAGPLTSVFTNQRFFTKESTGWKDTTYKFYAKMSNPIFIKEGWKLNPNSKIVNGILKGLERCNGHCPCHNKYAGTEYDICPCKAYLEEDICCCTLYVKDNGTS